MTVSSEVAGASIDGMEGRSTGWLVAGRYEVGPRIGRGAFGSVYRAFDHRLRREVALKLVLAHRASPRTVERLLREGRRLSLLRAPTLARAVDAGWDPGYGAFFLAMELARGEPLASRLERLGPRPHAEVGRVVGDVAAALAALHRDGVVHRDVTPSNVVVETDGRGRVVCAVLVDLGSAWHADEARLTSDGVLIGSNGYVAPELAMSGRIGPAADQYALACIAYEMSEGARPFEADHPLALLARHASAPRPVARNLPGHAAAAVRRAMAIDPAARFESVRAFSAALGAREAGGTVPAPRPGLARAVPAPARTKRRGITR